MLVDWMNQVIDVIKEIAPWLLSGSVVLQLAPIKISPWTWVARTIGRAINHDIMEEVKTIKKEVADIKTKNENQDEERKKDRALSARRRILQFADEARRGERHSLEHFNNIFEDIDFYESFCSKHKDFPNEKAVASIEKIKDVYRSCQDRNDFL